MNEIFDLEGAEQIALKVNQIKIKYQVVGGRLDTNGVNGVSPCIIIVAFPVK